MSVGVSSMYDTVGGNPKSRSRDLVGLGNLSTSSKVICSLADETISPLREVLDLSCETYINPSYKNLK